MQYSSKPIFGGDDVQTYREMVGCVKVRLLLRCLHIALIWRFILQESVAGPGSASDDMYGQQVQT